MYVSPPCYYHCMKFSTKKGKYTNWWKNFQLLLFKAKKKVKKYYDKRHAVCGPCCIYCLLNDKKSAKKVWSKDLVYEKTFQLWSHTPLIQFNVLSRTYPVAPHSPSQVQSLIDWFANVCTDFRPTISLKKKKSYHKQPHCQTSLSDNYQLEMVEKFTFYLGSTIR